MPNGCTGTWHYEWEDCDVAQCPQPTVCPGDLNCDGLVNFGDINPFVQYLADYSLWVQNHPACPPQNGDINADGVYPSTTDINPFVALLSQGARPCSY
jgi:hypothetical protein